MDILCKVDINYSICVDFARLVGLCLLGIVRSGSLFPSYL